MLRDFKFLRSDSGRKEEAENVPVDPNDLSATTRTSSESSRAPFNQIQDPAQNPKPEQELGIRSRVEKTPTKASKAKASDPALPLRTPDKHGAAFSARKRFGWAQKNDSGDFHEDAANCSTQVSRGGGSNGNGGLANLTPRIARTLGKGNSSYSESNSTHTTPTKSVSKPPNSGFRTGSVGTRGGNFAALYKGIPISSGPSMTVVNSVEVPHFDLKEDTSFWMEHNVQVKISTLQSDFAIYVESSGWIVLSYLMIEGNRICAFLSSTLQVKLMCKFLLGANTCTSSQ